MRQEIGPTPEDFKKLNKREEALEDFKEELEQGLSKGDEEFKQEKERTIKELGGEIVERNKDKKNKKQTIH